MWEKENNHHGIIQITIGLMNQRAQGVLDFFILWLIGKSTIVIDLRLISKHLKQLRLFLFLVDKGEQ